MAGKVISIEIGYVLTKICETDYKSKSHKIYKSFSVPTPEGILSDGVLQVNAEFVESIKSALAVNRVKAKQVVFTVTSAKIASREVTIPYVKESRILDVVKANASDYFPVDLSQYQLAYSILGTLGTSKEDRQYKLLVMAAPQALLSGYLDLAKRLKLEVVAIDYASNSIYQLVKEECSQGAHMIIKLDERMSQILVVRDSLLTFSRSVSYGVEETIDTVMESLCWGEITDIHQAIRVLQSKECIAMTEDQPTYESSDSYTNTYQSTASYEGNANDGSYKDDGMDANSQIYGNANSYETENGYGNTDSSSETTNVSGTRVKSNLEKAQESVRDSLLPLVGGIARVIDYYVSRAEGGTIDRILITGLGADFNGLAELLAKETGNEVTIMRELAGWNLKRDFRNECFGEYMAAIGATVDPIGFQVEEKSKSKGGKKSSKGVDGTFVAVFVLIAGLVAAGVLAAIPVTRYMKLDIINRDLKQKEQELLPAVPVYNTYVTTKDVYNRISALYDATENRNDSLYEFLLELERKVPSDVAFVSFTSDIETVTINMRVADYSEAAATIEQMRTFDSLIPETVSMAAVTEEKDEESGVSTVNFTIVANYQPVDYVPEDEAADETVDAATE